MREDELILNSENNVASFAEVASFHSLLFLFGELGSGKSTLVADYLLKLIKEDDEGIGFLIPAKFFLKGKFDTITDFINKLSLFINNEIISLKENFNLREALDKKNDLTVIIDGFDEVDPHLAQNLLRYSEIAVEKWPNLKVISTGRPVELKGLNYHKWQCLRLADLDKNEQEQLLLNEAISEGVAQHQAILDSQKRIKLLYKNSELRNIANTPLVIRLLRPYLNNGQNKSLGDLLYEVIKEKLGEWDNKDGKEVSVEDFKSAYPDVIAREELLGLIANKINDSAKKSINREALQTILQRNIRDFPNKNAIVSQALYFFCKSLLVEEGGTVTFPSQPIFQCALGSYILNQLINQNLSDPLVKETKHWREVSFAATIARRKGIFGELRSYFENYIENLMKLDGGISPAAMIVSESRDNLLAVKMISLIKEKGFRPITYTREMETESILAFSNVIYLSNDIGFNWFYQQYLNPRYPLDCLDYFNSPTIKILQNWLIKKDFQLDYKQKKQLLDLFMLLSYNKEISELFTTLCIVFSNAIPDKKLRYRHLTKGLTHSNLTEKAEYLLKDEFQKGNQNQVLEALVEEENINASCLWLELCKDKPQLSIVKNVINNSLVPHWTFLYEELKERLDTDKINQLLKWFTLREDKTSPIAAILLFKSGEKSLNLLGKALINGLHDGGKVSEAENVLDVLIKDNGEIGLNWLFKNFNRSNIEHSSSFWRILLTCLIESNKEYLEEFEKMIPFLGKFILSRYPDIRRKFKILLEKKPHYYNLLRNLLDSINILTRYNSACILFSSYPIQESKACEIIIRSTQSLDNQNEWRRFCMNLHIGEGVLNHIEKTLISLNGIQKIFALLLLYYNNSSIGMENKGKLIEGLLGKGRSLQIGSDPRVAYNTKKLLEDESMFTELIAMINSVDMTLSKEASYILLDFHNQKLTTKERLKCLLLCCTSLPWNLNMLQDIKDTVKENMDLLEFTNKYIAELNEIEKRETFISIYIKTIHDNRAWEDLLWEGLCNRDSFGDLELRRFSLWLFEQCENSINLRDIIGKAARRFLNDERITSQKNYNNTIYWLSFFENEFGSLENIDLSKIIKEYEYGDKGLFISILSRLETSPVLSDRIASLKHKKTFYQKEDILQIIRNSDDMHPRFIECIDSILYYELFSSDELETIAHIGKFGLLLSLIIQYFLYDYCDIDLLSKVSIKELFIYKRNKHQGYIEAERTVNFVKEVAISELSRKELYLSKLLYVFENNANTTTIRAFEELLKYNFSITNEMWSKFWELIVDNYHLLRGNLSKLIINFFILNKDDIEWNIILQDLEKVASTIYSINLNKYSANTGIPELLVSLLILHQKEEQLATDLFLLGLRSIFIDRNIILQQHDPVKEFFKAEEVLKILEPLISLVSPHIINKAILRGINSDMSELSALCRVLYSINNLN